MAQKTEIILELLNMTTVLTQNVQTYIRMMQDMNTQKDAQIVALQAEYNTLVTAQKDTESLFEEALSLQKSAEDKANQHQKLLYAEMNKVDAMQVELELALRERDMSLRKHGITPEQKQLLVKMEYEGYKINETLERIEHISDMIKNILVTETALDSHDTLQNV